MQAGSVIERFLAQRPVDNEFVREMLELGRQGVETEQYAWRLRDLLKRVKAAQECLARLHNDWIVNNLQPEIFRR